MRTVSIKVKRWIQIRIKVMLIETPIHRLPTYSQSSGYRLASCFTILQFALRSGSEQYRTVTSSAHYIVKSFFV